jgi:hypothetical protein
VSTVVSKGAAVESERGRRDWRDPFTARIWRGLPVALAGALDALVVTATPQEHRRWAVVREQVGWALRIYAQRDALARARDELHAVDDGLLPASAERVDALRGHVRTFRELRDHAIAEAVNDHGCPLELAALAGAIGAAEAQRIARENPLR